MIPHGNAAPSTGIPNRGGKNINSQPLILYFGEDSMT